MIKIPSVGGGGATTMRSRRITIQCNRSTKDKRGNVTPNWQDVVTVSTLSWRTLSGREYFLAQQIKSEASDLIRIRFIPSLKIRPGTHQVKYATASGVRHFDINAAVNLNEQGQYLDLLCKEAT